MTEAYEWQGRKIVGSDDEKIGEIREIYVDEHTARPEWATVTSGLFGTKSHFVPLEGASADGEEVRVRVTKDQVRDAPSIDPDGHLSEQEEIQLFEHFGLSYSREGSVAAEGPANGQIEPNGSAEGHDTGGPTSDDAMTRSEEELRVGTRQQESGRVRLRKHVVTEQVNQTVPVEREEIRVEREPITNANRDQALDGPEISEEEHEVVLHEEQPVVEKRVVPKERVSLGKEAVTNEREISEHVRKEQIEEPGAPAA